MIIDITTNPVYIEALEKGILEGMEKGIEKGMEKGILKGMEKGIQKANHTFVKKMLGDGLSVDVVQKYTGLSDDDLLDLMNDIKREMDQ